MLEMKGPERKRGIFTLILARNYVDIFQWLFTVVVPKAMIIWHDEQIICFRAVVYILASHWIILCGITSKYDEKRWKFKCRLTSGKQWVRWTNEKIWHRRRKKCWELGRNLYGWWNWTINLFGCYGIPTCKVSPSAEWCPLWPCTRKKEKRISLLMIFVGWTTNSNEIKSDNDI